MDDRFDAYVGITNHGGTEATEKPFPNSVFSVSPWLVTLIAFAAMAMVGCGRGTQTSQETAAGTPGAAEATVAQAVTDFPRPPKPSKAYRLGVSIPHLANPHYVGQAYGYIDEAQSLGAQVTLLEAGGYEHLDKQVSQVEDLIASKVDAIIIAAVSGPGTIGAVEAAAAAGIPVINVNVMTDSDKVVTRIRSDDDVIGRMQADFMGERLKGTGNVVMLRGAPGTSWAEIRGNAFRKQLAAKYPNVKVLGEQYSQSTPADGLRLMEDFLQTFPQISGVYNGADSTAVGAAQAVKGAGKAGAIVMTATDFQLDTEKFIREGVISASVLQQPVTMGRWGVRAAISYLEKKPVPPVMFTGLMTATKENLDSLDLTAVRAPAGWTPPTR
jgi:ABC-type sugar transport system substrate-binding protein